MAVCHGSDSTDRKSVDLKVRNITLCSANWMVECNYSKYRPCSRCAYYALLLSVLMTAVRMHTIWCNCIVFPKASQKSWSVLMTLMTLSMVRLPHSCCRSCNLCSSRSNCLLLRIPHFMAETFIRRSMSPRAEGWLTRAEYRCLVRQMTSMLNMTFRAFQHSSDTHKIASEFYLNSLSMLAVCHMWHSNTAYACMGNYVAENSAS